MTQAQTESGWLSELGLELDTLDESSLDAYPFGVIRLDPAGVVLSYNAFEERFARRNRDEVIGKNFFRDVAPCTRVRAFHGRFLDGVRRGALRVTFDFVFKFVHGDRQVEITMFSRPDASIWVVVRG